MTKHAADFHKPVRRTLNMDPLEPEPDQQQQEHVVLVEKELVLLEEQDQGVDNTDFPHNDDDNTLNVPPIPPPNAPEMEGVHPDFANDGPDHPDKSKIMDSFEQYLRNSRKNRSWMDRDTRAGTELLHLLQKHGSVSLYDKILDWHLANLDANKRITKNNLVETLRQRYNMEGSKPFIYRVILPSSGVKCRIPCHDAWAMMLDLLTDPRIMAEDYLWFLDDPFGAPPTEWLELEDINDGLAYRKTYEKVILPQPYTETGRRRVLLPVIGYMDGCVTGFNENLSIELMKFTLGIFNSKARDKEYTWRNLGAVPQFQKVKAKAVENLEKSGHVDANGYLSLSESDDDTPDMRKFTREYEVGPYIDSEDEDLEDMCDVPIPATDPQDLHVILQVIMAGMRDIFRTKGFNWDFYHNGERRRLEFIPFMLFMKGDTVEHDKHTGHYGARNEGVKSLCRYCVCPNEETDNPYADYARKSPEMLVEYIQKYDMDGLKAISQQFIFNSWYEFCFGLHNKLSIHGACPMEILHWIQLGMFKYSRGSLFDLTGPHSQLTRLLDTIATQMGWLFQRQSDRAYPRTKFTKGVQKGTLMAHEMTGLILVLIATLRSSQGRKAILDAKNANFPDNNAILAWIMMLELQVQFESFLKLRKMPVSTVIRLRTKVRELMELTKLIGRRQKGMKYKTNNFHSSKHVPDDILLFGPPHTVNSMANEMHHKSDKRSAKSTQKRPKSFDYQCAARVEERRILEMALEELKGRPRWDYFTGFERHGQLKLDRIVDRYNNGGAKSPKKPKRYPNLTGVKAVFEYDEENGYGYEVKSSMNRKNRFRYPPYIVGAVADLAEEVSEYAPSLTVFSELQLTEGVLFRAAPFYQGKPWYDWAMARVGEQIEGFEQRVVPVHIRCFVDLNFLPDDNTTKYAPGCYMIVEPTRLNPDAEEIGLSDLFVPFLKDEAPNAPNKVVFLPVANITRTACVIPDTKHPSQRAFLRVRPMEEWANLFQTWVHSEHAVVHQEPNIGE